MPYIGKGANGFGIRERYRYSASGSQTAFTGSDLDSKTLQFDSGSLLDVYLNGVLLDTADYNTNTANQVTLTSGATASDEVMIVVYDVFSLSDAMPKTGGTFTGAVTHTGAFTSKGIDDNADATAITITSDEAVGIGKSLTPNNYSGYQSLTIGGSDATTGATVDLEDSSGNLEGRINGTNGIVYIEADPNGSTGASKISLEVDGSAKMTVLDGGDVNIANGNLVIGTSGKGIDFSVGADGTSQSNVLDEYEEGLFNLSMNGFSFQTNSQGRYLKIGKLVHFTAFIHALGSQNSNTANLDLPFTIDANAASSNVGYYTVAMAFQSSHNTNDGTHPSVFMATGGNTNITLRLQQEDGARTNATNNVFSSEDQMMVSGMYIASS